jgi:N-acetyl sugar amidotransferase
MTDVNKIRYCKKCIIPETRPHTEIGEDGICSGCKYFDQRNNIDWDRRKSELLKIFNKYKDNGNYDCIIPSSGGKDSTYQVLKVIEFGLRPLVITVATDMLTPIGRKNIENLKHKGIDCLEFTPNPILRKKINKLALDTVGDITWTEECAIFCVVTRFSVKMGIPLIIWGENPENENGGPEQNADFFEDIIQKLDDEWFETFRTNGLRSSDILDFLKKDGVTEMDLQAYTFPDKNEVQKNGTIGIFLGHYLPWDGHSNAEFSIKNGFTTYDKWVEGSIVNYENLDNYQMRIHDYFKFLKYGYDRVSDWSSLAIRRGRMKREEAVELSRTIGGKYPKTYLGKNLEEILEYLELTKKEFDNICYKFTNKKIFKNSDGILQYDNKGNLIKTNYDNIE